MTEGPRRALGALLCLLGLTVPFLVARLPPITDLPQHVSQMRLLGEALASPEGPYRVQWLTPYVLAYLPMRLLWAALPPLLVGKVAFLALGVLWVVAAHTLAAARGRSATAAALATVFFFSHTLYWGFYCYAFGWPLFLLWFHLTTRGTRRERPGPAELGRLALLATALYLTHALWFAMACLWLVLHDALFRVPARAFLPRVATVTPAGVAAVLWFLSFSHSSMGSPTRFWAPVLLRILDPGWIVDSFLGGIRGPTEAAVLLFLLGWAGLAIATNRERIRERVDPELLLLSGTFFLLALILPYSFRNTVLFAERWAPYAGIALLLALPAPRSRARAASVVAAATLAAFLGRTAATWAAFQGELSGLMPAVESLPASSRVLGLTFRQTSPRIKGAPFVQTFAYAEVLKGCELNFSFSHFSSSLVVLKDPISPWTGGLEWFPIRVRGSDFGHFDYVLVAPPDGDPEEGHRRFASASGLTPVTTEGIFRLYRGLRVTGRAGG